MSNEAEVSFMTQVGQGLSPTLCLGFGFSGGAIDSKQGKGTGLERSLVAM